MLELKRFYHSKDEIVAGFKKRGMADASRLVSEVLVLDERRKEVQTKLDEVLSLRNQKSKDIGILYKQGKREKADALKADVYKINTRAEVLEDELKVVRKELDETLVQLPNVPNHQVPSGTCETDNKVWKKWNRDLPELFEGALPHWELAKKYDLIDFELGAKIAGAGFPLFRSKGSRLKRALINFFLDRARLAGYEEIQPPLLVNGESAYSTGNLPDKEGQMYHAEKDDLYLIPTAEVPITNIFRDVILKHQDLPYAFTGYTPCFRREAGSYGADVKGLNRVHQFDKVEIVRVEHPDNSYNALQDMVAHISSLLEALELPYRILTLCGGDLSFTSALTYDFEIYSAGQKRWLEVSSVSNFETFQSNRLKCRFTDEDGKKKLVHTLNGSALALARIVAGLLEVHQTSEGIVIPKVLIPYTGFDIID